jgi:imidazolonepropionase-like amidohydrolase
MRSAAHPGGATLLTGLIDSHTHLIIGGEVVRYDLAPR